MSSIEKFDRGETRDSGIETLKVISILLIVISHIVQTLSSENTFVGYNDYILNLSCATTNSQYILLMILRHFGALGNNIFFVCSAWFLLDSKKVSERKIADIMSDVWMISVIILAIVHSYRGG